MVTDASLARNERGPYGRGRAGRPGDAVVAEKCPFCLWDLQKWWPHIRAPVFLGGPAHGAADGAEVRETISEVRLCHLKCAEESLEARGGPGGGRGVKIEADFASSLRELLLRSPNLFARRAAARVSLEEERLQEVARSDEAPRWPFRELPAPPSATFAVEGIREMRLQRGGMWQHPVQQPNSFWSNLKRLTRLFAKRTCEALRFLIVTGCDNQQYVKVPTLTFEASLC